MALTLTGLASLDPLLLGLRSEALADCWDVSSLKQCCRGNSMVMVALLKVRYRDLFSSLACFSPVSTSAQSVDPSFCISDVRSRSATTEPTRQVLGFQTSEPWYKLQAWAPIEKQIKVGSSQCRIT